MIILSIDSAGLGCAASIWRDGQTLAYKSEKMERGQDARLIPLIIETLQQANLEFATLDRIAVTRGPGSFTGLRVGLAAARGIGLAAGKPVLGIDRFSIYRALHPQGDLLAVINSRRAELFCRFYPAAAAPREPELLTQTEIADHYPNTPTAGDITTPHDDILAACAQLASTADPKNPDYLPRPLYLRAPDVTFAVAKSR